ncbi:thioredoxin-like isoform X2 [Lycorma delicatula]
MIYNTATNRKNNKSKRESKSLVTNLESLNEWKQLLEDTNGKILIVKFYAPWCIKCKEISPLYDQLSVKNKKLKFLKINVNKFKQLSNEWNIEGVPTFMFFTNEKKVKIIKGADRRELIKGITEASLVIKNKKLPK